MDISDQQLVADYLKGDKRALEILISRYLKLIYNLSFRYCGNNLGAAEDLTQEIFIKVWKNLKKFDPGRSRVATLQGKPDQSFKIWLLSIARNAAIDFLRKRKDLLFSEFENEDGENTILSALADPSFLADEAVDQTNSLQKIKNAIGSLSSKYQTIFSLHFDNGLTFQEIAQSLGEPLDTVKSRYRRALLKLRKELKD